MKCGMCGHDFFSHRADGKCLECRRISQPCMFPNRPDDPSPPGPVMGEAEREAFVRQFDVLCEAWHRGKATDVNIEVLRVAWNENVEKTLNLNWVERVVCFLAGVAATVICAGSYFS